MKKTIQLTLLFSIVKFLAGCSDSTFLMGYGYNTRGDKVYYKNAFPGGTIVIEGADGRTFKVIFVPGDSLNNSNTDFAVDKNHAYYGGGPIEGSDGNSFRILDRNFSKDKGQCYFHGKPIPGADPLSFVIKNELFSADRNNIYQGTAVIDNDPSLFESFDSSSVVHTKNTASVFDSIITINPGSTFEFLRYNYFAIDGQVYFQGSPVPDAGSKGFKPLDDFIYVTTKHVYYGDKIIKDADPATYRLLVSPYGRDAKHIFFFERMIEKADPNSFEIINTKFQCSRDKHTVWHEDIKIESATAEDLVNKKECTSCNEKSIYFSEK